MCDVIVIDSAHVWDKGSPCERRGKFVVEVENVNLYDDNKGEKFRINVCGQHKSMLDRRRRLEVKHLGKSYTVQGQESEVGKAEKEVEHAQREYESQLRSAQHVRASIGEAADFAFDRLLEVTDGDNQLRDFVGTLLRYREAKNATRAAYQKVAEAESKVARLKALTN